MKTIIISLLLAAQLLAGESTVKLKAGDISPFDGFLLKKERVVELDKAERKIPLLEAKISLQEDLVEFHRDEAGKARRNLSKERWEGNLKGVYGFLIGVATMSIAFKLTEEIR